MFTVTIENVHDKQLGALIAQIGTRKHRVHLTHHPEVQPAPGAALVRKQMGDDTFLSLTGKKGREGSMREKVLEMMELLEKEHGIGNVTRGMLKEKLVKAKFPTPIVYQLVHDGFLKKR